MLSYGKIDEFNGESYTWGARVDPVSEMSVL